MDKCIAEKINYTFSYHVNQQEAKDTLHQYLIEAYKKSAELEDFGNFNLPQPRYILIYKIYTSTIFSYSI